MRQSALALWDSAEDVARCRVEQRSQRVNLHARRLLGRGAAAPPVCPLARAGRVGAMSGEKAAADERKRRAGRTAMRSCIGRKGSRVDRGGSSGFLGGRDRQKVRNRLG